MSAIQAYLRAVAADGRQLIAIDAFDVFLDPNQAHPHSNYAIPRDAAEPSEQAIGELIGVMHGAGRIPRLEYLLDAAPAVEAALTEADFYEELRSPVMTCAPDDLQAHGGPERVTLHQVAPDATKVEIDGLMRALAVAFDDPYDPATAASGGARLLRRVAVIAYADEQVAGGGMCLDPIGDTVELVGIGVLPDFRRRGIATAITGELARLAFESGATTAFLTPGPEATERVYESVGFQTSGEMLHLVHRV